MSLPTSRESCPGWCSPSTRTMMRSESTESMMPLRRASTTAPESRAVTPSMPVPTMGAVMFQEGHQGRRHRNELLRTDVDVIHLVAVDQHKVAGLAGVDEFRNNAALVINLGVGLRDYVAVLLPR